MNRKPARAATTSRQSPRLPLLPVRREIWDAARDLMASGDAREVSAVLVHEGLKHERVAATLRSGIVSTLEQAREAYLDAEAA